MAKYVGLVLVVLMLQAHQTMSAVSVPEETRAAILEVFEKNKLLYTVHEYDVSSGQGDPVKLITGIGADTTRRCTHKFGDLKVLPRLTGKYNDPPEWNVHILVNGLWAAAVLTRSDDVYLKGYWTDITGWMEIETRLLYPYSTKLPFGASYLELNGEKKNLTSLPLSGQSLGDAVKTLATTTDTKEFAVKRAVLVLVLMLSETQRFTAIRYCVLRHWHGEGCFLSEKDVAFSDHWGELSCFLMEGFPAVVPGEEEKDAYASLRALMKLYHVAEEDVPGMLVVLLLAKKCQSPQVIEGLTPIGPPIDPPASIRG